jgi:2-polyprenyl-6-methoxyphenol hydroxylase-like FAD-dependent oxidoreductase
LHARLTAAASSTEHHDSPRGEDHRGAWAHTPDGVMRGDVLIGADGHRSIVRAAVAPEHPDATFAGYVLWISIADERTLPPVPQGFKQA